MNVVYGDAISAWIERQTGGSYDPRAVSIGLIRENWEILAGILYESSNGASAVCHMAATGRLTRDFLWTNADYAFRQLGLNKLIAPISSKNERIRKILLKMGFVREALLRNCDPDGHLLLYTLAKEDCRFLEEKYKGAAYRKTKTSCIA